jgi:2-polyprenyl-6-methoxyphenol hydroxylase-like FAD-dependent oxidoreductase
VHPETGLAAIKACGLASEFEARTIECAEAAIVADQHGTVVWSAEGDGMRPEISRHALTRLLLSRLPDECIEWEHKLVSVSASESADQNQARYALNFGSLQGEGEGRILTADLVIGADGAWSRTRTLLTETQPHYSGVHMITITIPDLTSRYPASLSALVGAGSLIAVGDGNAIISQRGAGGSARIYLVISTGDEDLGSSSGLESLPSSEVEHLLLSTTATGGKGGSKASWRNFSTWGPKPKELISRALADHAKTGDALDIRPMHMLPVGQLAWTHRASATLLGDAAHLMTPFAGEGVNLALRDALDLAGAITRAWDAAPGDNAEGHDSSPQERRNAFKAALDPLVQDFETAMIKRGEEAAEETWGNLQLFFGEDAAKKVAAMFQQ